MGIRNTFSEYSAITRCSSEFVVTNIIIDEKLLKEAGMDISVSGYGPHMFDEVVMPTLFGNHIKTVVHSWGDHIGVTTDRDDMFQVWDYNILSNGLCNALSEI